MQVDQVSHAFAVGDRVQVSGPPAGVGSGLCKDVLDQPACQVGVRFGRDHGGLVGVPAASGTHVERGPVHALIDQLHRLIDGEALRAVAGDGVSQLQMLPHCPRRQMGRPCAVDADQPDPSVVVDGADSPAFPVGVPAAVHSLGVDTGGDDVPGAERLGLPPAPSGRGGDRQALADDSGGDQLVPDEPVELLDLFVRAGDDQAATGLGAHRPVLRGCGQTLGVGGMHQDLLHHRHSRLLGISAGPQRDAVCGIGLVAFAGTRDGGRAAEVRV